MLTTARTGIPKCAWEACGPSRPTWRKSIRRSRSGSASRRFMGSQRRRPKRSRGRKHKRSQRRKHKRSRRPKSRRGRKLKRLRGQRPRRKRKRTQNRSRSPKRGLGLSSCCERWRLPRFPDGPKGYSSGLPFGNFPQRVSRSVEEVAALLLPSWRPFVGRGYSSGLPRATTIGGAP